MIDNFRALCHDPKEFPEPDLLIPERFLKNGKFNVPGRDPAKLNFGFGRRRVCFLYNFERVLIILQGMSWKSHWHFNVVHLCCNCIGTFRYWESSRWEGQHNRAKLPVQQPGSSQVCIIILENAQVMTVTSYRQAGPFNCTIRPRSQEAIDTIQSLTWTGSITRHAIISCILNWAQMLSWVTLTMTKEYHLLTLFYHHLT